MANESHTIGITGHRQLPPKRGLSLTAEIQSFYCDEASRYGAENITVLSSLAEGADTRCAKIAHFAGFRLIVPLPMNSVEYRNDFTDSAAAEFDSLLSLVDGIFVVTPSEPIPLNPSRGFFYRQAGIYIANNCDVLLAVWDGVERDTPDGAGTWETVKIARKFGREIRILKI